MVLWIKGFDGPRTQTYLSRESNKFLTALGVKNGVIDPRSGQQSVKVSFTSERAAEEALEKFRALENKGELRLVPDKDKLARTTDGLVGRVWRAVENALRREKLRGKVTANRGLVCVEIGVDDVVSIVAKISFQAELTIQPGHASLGLADPDAFRAALEELVSPNA